jgi:hypothetical protein
MLPIYILYYSGFLNLNLRLNIIKFFLLIKI